MPPLSPADARKNYLAPFERLRKDIELEILVELRVHDDEIDHVLSILEAKTRPSNYIKWWKPVGTESLFAPLVVEAKYPDGSPEATYLDLLAQTNGTLRSDTFVQDPVLLTDWIKIHNWWKSYSNYATVYKTEHMEPMSDLIEHAWKSHRAGNLKALQKSKAEFAKKLWCGGGEGGISGIYLKDLIEELDLDTLRQWQREWQAEMAMVVHIQEL